MSTWAIIGIIALVIGMLISNIMLLKYSAKFKMPKTYTPPEPSNKDNETHPPEKPSGSSTEKD